MTDKEIYERFMLWMGMKPHKTKNIEGNTVVNYIDTYKCDESFSKLGYDAFNSGAIFDEKGAIVKGYIDSHVAYSSNNCEDIEKMLYDSPEQTDDKDIHITFR